MNLQTYSVTVCAPRDTVFNFLADIENLPRWATGFCERLYVSRGRWKGLTVQGELWLVLEACGKTGIIDLRAGPSLDRLALLPLRVLALGERSTLVSVTFVAAPEWPGELLQREAEAVAEELRGLTGRFGGGELHVPEREPQLLELGLN